MGLHLYCVTASGIAPPVGLCGVDGAPVLAVALDGVSVWASSAAAAPRASVAGVRAHHAVVEAAMDAATPVPLRFGQWLADEAALRAATRDRVADWAEELRTLVGTAEYGVRVLDPRLPPAARDVRPAAGVSGRAYLEALAGRDAERARRTAAGTAVAAALDDRLGTLVRRTRTEPLATAHGLVSIAHLVVRSDEAAYRAALSDAAQRFAELRLVPSGPWPPWSFVA